MKKTENSASQYFGVGKAFNNKIAKVYWSAQATAPNGNKINTTRPTEREAAKAVDLFLIRNGLEPRNILKRKI